MTNAIADGMGNSLSPEPCALSPAELRLHANLTVGAPDAPAISRPDVADVGMPIEHLDFEPPCEASNSCRDQGTHPAEYSVLTTPYCCAPNPLRLWCQRALMFNLSFDGETWPCPRCGGPRLVKIIYWEPLR